MRKIWIVRERLDWHNADPDDVTIAYSTKELAEAGLIERIEDVKKYFRENDYELFDASSDAMRMPNFIGTFTSLSSAASSCMLSSTGIMLFQPSFAK